MRWMTLVAMAAMAAGCDVEEADVAEADGEQRMFEEGVDLGNDLTIVTNTNAPNCNKKPWSSSFRCRPGGEQVQSQAGTNPEGHDPIELKINGGLLYGKLDEKTGGVIISFDREGTEVAAEVYGLERVESITVMDAPDQWESAVSAVHLEIVAGDSVVTVPNIIDFETEAGFNAESARK